MPEAQNGVVRVHKCRVKRHLKDKIKAKEIVEKNDNSDDAVEKDDGIEIVREVPRPMMTRSKGKVGFNEGKDGGVLVEVAFGERVKEESAQ